VADQAPRDQFGVIAAAPYHARETPGSRTRAACAQAFRSDR